MEKPIERAITAAGGLSALAGALGLTPQVVNNWKKRGVPAKQAIAVEQATGISRKELCPSVFDHDEAGAA